MLVTPDMDNGFRPIVGQKVRVIGKCRPRALGQICTVTNVRIHNGEGFFQCVYTDSDGNEVFGGGLLGGLEPVE